METRFNYDGEYLYLPVVFRADFNSGATLSATQAWSMFFTASHEDTALGFTAETGRFWTNMLLAATAAGILGVLVFQGI